MPLYEVEIKTRVTVLASDRDQAKVFAAKIASRIPIANFEMAARRSLKELEKLPDSYGSNQPSIGK